MTRTTQNFSEKERAYLDHGGLLHDELARRAGVLIEIAHAAWDAHAPTTPSLVLLWPSKPLEAVDGQRIEDEVFAAYPETHLVTGLRALVAQTEACGLFALHVQKDHIRGVFETSYGARTWHMRVERHGDREVLLPPVVRDNADYLGVLWSPHAGTA